MLTTTAPNEEEELSAPGPPADRGWRFPRPGVGTMVTFALLAMLLIENRHLFTVPIHEDGDAAANAILIDRARAFRLLVGNYSRVGFNHPGPAFLYVQGFAQSLLHGATGIVPTPFNAHLIGAMALTSALLGAAATIVWAHVRIPLAPVAIVVATVVLVGGRGEVLASTWMPHLYIAPFLLLLIATASVVSGRSRSLPMLVVAIGLLVHGHVAFLPFAGSAAVAAGLALVLRRRHGDRIDRSIVVWSSAIAALFLLPIVVNVVIHFPGEFGRYLRYATAGDRPRNDVLDVVRYFLAYWPGGGALVIVLGLTAAAVGVVVGHRRDEERRFLAALLATASGAFIVCVAYGITGIDDLKETYIGLFATALPVTLIVVVIIGAVRFLGDLAPTDGLRSAGSVVVGVVMVAVAVVVPDWSSSYRGDGRLPEVTKLLAAEAGGEGHPVLLQFAAERWPWTLGLLEQGARRGHRFCALDPQWEVLVSPGRVCDARDRANGTVFRIELPDTQVPNGRRLWQDASTTVWAQTSPSEPAR